MTGKKYKKSPIIEAICEFQFEENSPWDLTIPGLVYEKVRRTFPKRRQATRVSLGKSASAEELGPQFGTTSLMQFFRADEKAIIQVGPNLLSINILKPYPSWEKFLPLIKKGFNSYCDVVAPKGIRRIGLRYINQIELPGQNINLEDYLEFRPFVGSKLPQDFVTFLVGVQIPYEESRDILNIQLTSLPRNSISEDRAALIFSLDYVLMKPTEITLDGAFKWINTAHSRIEEAFEASISQQLRGLFKEVRE